MTGNFALPVMFGAVILVPSTIACFAFYMRKEPEVEEEVEIVVVPGNMNPVLNFEGTKCFEICAKYISDIKMICTQMMNDQGSTAQKVAVQLSGNDFACKVRISHDQGPGLNDC